MGHRFGERPGSGRAFLVYGEIDDISLITDFNRSTFFRSHIDNSPDGGEEKIHGLGIGSNFGDRVLSEAGFLFSGSSGRDMGDIFFFQTGFF